LHLQVGDLAHSDVGDPDAFHRKVNDILAALTLDCVFIDGNHDPLPWLAALPALGGGLRQADSHLRYAERFVAGGGRSLPSHQPAEAKIARFAVWASTALPRRWRRDPAGRRGTHPRRSTMPARSW
jgi:hypothetical protein